jgi:hypothetical protein
MYSMVSEAHILPVYTHILCAFGITICISVVEAWIAHAFHNALKNEHVSHVYTPLPVEPADVDFPTTATLNMKKNPMRNWQLHRKADTTLIAMKINPFVQRMQLQATLHTLA